MRTVMLSTALSALAVGLGGCGAANEDDAARETKAVLAGGGRSDSFGVKCKKKGEKTFSCTKYELSGEDPGKISAADILGEYEATCDKPNACKVRKADYRPGFYRRKRR